MSLSKMPIGRSEGRCLGVVFNKVQDKVALYESHNSMAYKAYYKSGERKYYN
jgi:hypothetical protein